MLVYQRVGGYTTHIRNHPHPFSESQQHCNVFNLKNVRPMTQIYFGIHHLCHFAKIYQNIPCILDPHILVYFGIHHPIFEGNRCGSIPLPFWSLWQSPGRHVDDHFQESHRSSGQRHRKKNSRMKQNLGSAGYSATVFFFTTKVECTTQPYVLKQEISHDKWIMFTSYKPVQFYMHDMCIIYIYISTLQVCIDTYRETNPHAIWHVCIYIYEYIHMCIYCTNQLEHFYTGYPRSAIFGT